MTTSPLEHLKKQIGQMVVVRASGYLFDQQIRYPAWEPPHAKLQHWLETLNLGGVILLGGSAAEIALRSQQLQQYSPTRLLIAADIEEGVGQRFAGATWLPPPMALGAIAKNNLTQAEAYARQMGAITAQEALAIGINWILAPLVDVNNNADNPVINIRSFSDNPDIVSRLANAFIAGAKAYAVLTTAKHFPGHGDTVADSHLALPVLPHSPSRLAEIELPPFKSAIAAGVDSVMTAHISIPTWDSQNPATLSQAILTGQLRQNLGFEGLIVTDALIMSGVTKDREGKDVSPAEVAVRAVEAGVDILLMPPDPEVAINAVYEAVQSGRLTHERIERSLTRIWQAKAKIFTALSSPSLSLWQLAQPQARQMVNMILRESMASGGSFPVIPRGRNLIVVDDLLNCDFLNRQTPAVIIPKQLGYELQLVDQNTLAGVQEDARPTILQVFIRGNPFRGSAGLTAIAQNFYGKILQKDSLKGLIIYGSPYVSEWFQAKLSPQLPWIFSYGQMPMAQAIACSKLLGLSQFLGLESDTFVE